MYQPFLIIGGVMVGRALNPDLLLLGISGFILVLIGAFIAGMSSR